MLTLASTWLHQLKAEFFKTLASPGVAELPRVARQILTGVPAGHAQLL
jgi:hypothetical protein